MQKHLQRIVLLVAMMLLPGMMHAQSLSDYSLTTDTTTFTSIVSTGSSITFSSTDDGSGSCTLPFAFAFGESSLASGSSVALSANGFIQLGASSTSGTTGSYTTTTYRTINPLLNVDAHMARNTGAGAYYEYDATNGVFTIEYHLLGCYSTPYGAYSFQVKLHQNGDIEFIYDSVNYGGGSPTLRAFLWDGPTADRLMLSGTWDNPTVGTTAATMPSSSAPAHGLRYYFHRPVISCPKVVSIAASDFTPTQATISWVDTTGSSSWLFKYYPNDSLSLVDSFVVTDTVYNFTALDPDRFYTAMVANLCDAGDTSLFRSITFHTPCLFLQDTNLPYSEGFESYATGSAGSINPCWSKGTNSTTPYPYVNAVAYSGSKSLYFYAYHPSSATSTPYYSYAVLPGIDSTVSLQGLTLSFAMRNYSNTSNTYSTQLRVGVMTNPADISTFETVETINLYGQAASSWHNINVNFANYTGTGRFICLYDSIPTLETGATYDYSYVYVDDVVLDLTPACYAPYALSVDSVASDQVTLSWSGPAAADAYLVTLTSANGDSTYVVNDTTVVITDLASNTQYNVEVMATCSGDSSQTVATVFRTSCGALTLPYTQDFEAEQTGGSNNGTFASCWYRLNNGTSYFGYPYISSSTTYNHTVGGTKGLYWYNSTTTGSYGDYQIVIAPALDTTIYSINTLEYRFWARASSSSYSPVFQVGVMTDPTDASTFQTVGTVNVSGTTFAEYVVSLTSFSGNGQYLALRANRPTSSWYAYVDDITIRLAPQCPDVVALTAENIALTSANLTWTTQGGVSTPTSFTIEYDTIGATGTPQSATATSNHFLLTGLEAGTHYFARVYAVCDDGNGAYDSIAFTTVGLPCIALDPTTADTLAFGTGTTATSGCLVNSAWGNTFYQAIYTASELSAAGLTAGNITAVDFGFSASSSYSKEFSIYFGTTSMSSFSSASDMVNPANLTLCYGPNTFATGSAGNRHFEFDEPFYWDGVSNLILSTFMNQPTGTSQSSSSFSGYVTAGSTNCAVYRYQDGTQYTEANYTGGNAGSVSTNRASITFYKGDCAAYATCVAPSVVVDRYVADSVELSWAAGYQETNWDVDYRVHSASSWTNAETSTTNTSYIFDNLTPQTTYDFRITANCGDTTMATIVTLTTPCVAASLPFTENFSTFSTTTGAAFPACYGKISQYSSSYPYASTSYGYGATPSLYMYSYNTNATGIVLPIMDAPIDTLMVSFALLRSNTSYAHGVQVGVMSDPEDFNTFVPVQSCTPTSVTTWEMFEVPLRNYTGSGQYIAIMCRPSSFGATYGYPYLDDIEVNYIPQCARPTNVTYTDISGDSCTVTWNGSDANDYEVEYGFHGFSHGAGTVVNVSADTSVILTGLAGSTSYDCYVRCICNGGADTGAWSFVTRFNSACSEIPHSALPYFESFETWSTNSTGGTFTWTPGSPCWDYSTTYSSTSYHYPYVSTSYAVTGSNSLYFYHSGTGYQTDFSMPLFEDSVNTLMVDLFIRNQNYASPSYAVLVGVKTNLDQDTSFHQVAAIYPTVTGVWQEKEIDFSTYTGPNGYITFRLPSTSSYCYSYIDDITVMPSPDCYRPTSFTGVGIASDSIEVSWTPDSRTTDASYYIEWDTTGFEVGSATFDANITDGSTTFTIGGLTPDSFYDVYIWALCTDGDSSSYRKVTVHTPCVAIPTDSLPYRYGFEDCVADTNGSINPCWTKGYMGVSNYYPYVSTSYHAEGSKSLYFYGYSSTYYCYVAMPTFEEPISNLMLNFKLLKTSSTYGSIEVGVMTNPADPSTFTTIGFFQPEATSTWEQFSTTFGNYRGNGRFIAFRQASTYYTYLDDIEVRLAPSCPPVVNVNVPSVSTSSAYVTWGYQNGFRSTPEYYEVALVDSTGARVTDTTTNQSYMFTGLGANSTYTVVVNTVCENMLVGGDSAVFSTAGFACVEIDTTSIFSDTIGNGTATTNYLPSYSFYNYGYSQQIYRGTEFSGGGQIQSIAFMPSAVTQQRHFKVYLSHTTQSSVDNFIYSTDMVEVYDGTPSMTAGSWVTLNLDTPFSYNGSDNLLVTICDITGSYVSGNYFYCHTNGSNISRYLYQDSGPYSPSSVSGGNTTTSRLNMAFYGAGCATMGTCSEPLVRVSGASANQVDLLWAPGDNETSWDVEHKLATDSVWTTDLSGTTATSYSFTGLLENSDYNFRVINTCADGNDYITQVNVTTPCDAEALPFSESFATWATGTSGAFPSCWTRHTTYSYSYYPYVSPSYSVDNDAHSMYMYSTSGTYTYLVLPLFTAPVDSLSVTFALMRTNTSYSHALEVGVITDPDDFSTFQSVGTAMPGNTYEWNYHEFTFQGMPANGHICFVAPQANYCYPYLDDIVVDYNRSCARPSNLQLVNATLNSATITWFDTVTTDFEYEVGPAGFTRGTGTFGTCTGDTVTITGLAPSTDYSVYVRGICGAADTSNWSFTFNFATECAKIDTLPFFEDFNSIGTGTTVHAPHCWIGTSTYSTSYPYASTSYNHSGSGASMYMYHYNNGINYTILQLPGIDTTALPIDTLQLEFSLLSSYSGYTQGIVVGMCDSTGSMTSFQPIDTVVCSASTYVWENFEVPLRNYTGSGNVITLKAYSGSSSYCYPYLDDVRLVYIPSCPRPHDLTVVSTTTTDVTLSWTEMGYASQWEIGWDTVAASATPAFIDTATVNPSTITGLTPGTHYYFRVRSVCGAGDTSLWSEAVQATPGSWSMRLNQTDTIYMCGGTIYDDGGVSGAYSASQNSVLIIYPDSAANLVTLNGTFIGEGCCDYLTIFDGAGTSGTQLWYGCGNGSSATLNIGPFVSSNGPLTIRFTSDGSVQYDGFELNVGCMSTHCRVTNMALDNSVTASDSRLNVVWDDCGGLSYQVEYGLQGFTQGTGSSMTVFTNAATITGLTALTNYDVYVRSICGVGDTGDWAYGSFMTAMCGSSTVVPALDSSASAGTAYTIPVNNFYNYTATEVIFDSAEIGGPLTISAIQLYYTGSYSPTAKDDVKIYLKPTTKTTFSSSSDYENVDSTAVLVFSGDFNSFTTGWNVIGFDTVYNYDGLTNLMVIFDDNSGDYDDTEYTFGTLSCTGNKTLNYYSDSYNPDVTNLGSYSGSTYSYSYRPNMQFISCGDNCAAPVITSVTNDYESATISWSGEGSTYQVNIKETVAADWPATDITVTGNSYSFTGLRATTNYLLRVRQDCSADSTGFSDWVIVPVLTDSLPCFAPDNLAASDMTNADATFSWTTRGTESQWDLHVWFAGGLDSIYRVNSNPATVSGFVAGVTYNAAIRAICGSAELEGDWSDTVQFTTATCPDVTGLAASNVSFDRLTISWNTNPMAQSWIIEYGFQGFTRGEGTTVNATTNTYEVSGLLDDMAYDFNVKAVCGADWTSESWASVSATTAEMPAGTYTVTVNINNSAWGSVSGAGTYQEGQTCTLVATPASSDYEFLNWNGQITDNPYSFTVSGNVTINANFGEVSGQGIVDVESGVSCSIFPNPTTASTTISVSGVNGLVRISVIDISGRTLATESLECSADCHKMMDVNDLAQGTYFVRISSDSVNMVRKLIVK